MAKTRTQMTQRMQLLQKQLLETVTQGGSNDVTVSLNAYEETIEKLEHDVEALKKDFIMHRDKTSLEVK